MNWKTIDLHKKSKHNINKFPILKKESKELPIPSSYYAAIYS